MIVGNQLLVQPDADFVARLETQLTQKSIQQSTKPGGTHIYGTMMLSSTFSLVDEAELTVTGNADIFYSSEALSRTPTMLSAKASNDYTLLYRDHIK